MRHTGLETRPAFYPGEQAFDARAVAPNAMTIAIELHEHRALLVLVQHWYQVFSTRKHEDVGLLDPSVVRLPLVRPSVARQSFVGA